MKSYTTATIAFLILLSSAFAADDTQHFPGWPSWLNVDLPADFKMDPKSMEGEAKWWAKFDDPDSDLSVQVDSFGYINDLDLLLTIPGVAGENYIEKLDADKRPTETKIATDANHKNIGDYFKAEILPKGSKASKHSGYEQFIVTSKDAVTVYFLSADAYKETYGRCYQTLSFSFKEGAYSEHRKVIEAIIASAEPAYKKRSEQDGARQPATAPESKTEGNEKPKPESEGRSQ